MAPTPHCVAQVTKAQREFSVFHVNSDTVRCMEDLFMLEQTENISSDSLLMQLHSFLEMEINRTCRGKAMIIQATVLSNIGKPDTAIQILNKAVIDLGKIGNPYYQAEAFYQLGLAYHKAGNVNSAIISGQSAVKGFRLSNKKQDEAKALNKLGIFFKSLGDFENALRNYFDALAIYDKHPDKNGKALVLTNIGIIYKNREVYDKALDYHNRSLKLHLETGNRTGQGDCYNNIGVVYKNMSKYTEALLEYSKALEIWRQTTNKQKESFTLNNMGVVYSNMKKWDTALLYFDSSHVIKKELGDKLSISSLLINKSEVFINRGEYSKASEALQEALKQTLETGMRDVRLEVYQSLNTLYDKMHMYEEAYKYMKAFALLKDSLYGMEKDRIMNDLEAKYYQEREQEEQAHKEELQRATEEKEALNRERKEKEITLSRTLAISLIIITTLALLLVISMYRRYRFVKSSRSALEQTNEELRKTMISKDEKELLLKEIHHRVKNNMQIISSLLRLQSGMINDQNIRMMFQDTQQRIKSMSLVHEELYKTKDFAGLDVKQYLEKLTEELIDTYNINKTIHTVLKIDEVYLSIDTLIPLGLLINEIISNAFKHAFNGMNEGVLQVSLEHKNSIVTLMISDNGKGMKNIDVKQSLGMELIETLSDQLDAKMTLNTMAGYEYRFVFPVKVLR